jgi:hypothetical protein
VHETIVGAGPQRLTLVRRLHEREDRAVDLGAGVVVGDRSARAAELVRVVAREIRAHDLPALAFVDGAEDAVARDPQLARVPP